MTHLHKYGRKLHDRGLPIVPLVRGAKHPGLKNWQHLRATPELLASWDANSSYEGVGIQTERFPAIDIDVLDPVMAQQMEDYCREVLGPCAVRIGQPPKRLIPCRLPKDATPYTKITSATWSDFLGDHHKVEILASGQQYVAYAVHPATNKPYTWSDDSLLDPRLLPELSLDRARQIVLEFERLAEGAGWERGVAGSPGSVVSDEVGLSNLKPPLDINESMMREALDAIKDRAAEGRQPWRDVLFAIHHQTGGSEDGWEIANDWSAAGGDAYDEAATRAVWDSAVANKLSASPITFASVLKAATEARSVGNMVAKALEGAAPKQFLIPGDEFISAPAPIDWLIRGWLQEKGLAMLHGPSGAGKTFMALDWALHLSTRQPTWFDCICHGGPVVYLAGEGHYGLRTRAKAWATLHGVASLGDIVFSSAGARLDTVEGLNKAREAIRALPWLPKAIFVDTVHASMKGDENKSQDVGAFQDACKLLMAEFGCTVVLVHHTGLTADDRGRGSSAWRGAFDNELSVVASTGGKPIQIVDRKQKEAALGGGGDLWARLEPVTIHDWPADRDGFPITSVVFCKTDYVETGIKRDDLKPGVLKAKEAFDRVAISGDGLSEEGWRQSYYDLYGDKYDKQQSLGKAWRRDFESATASELDLFRFDGEFWRLI